MPTFTSSSPHTIPGLLSQMLGHFPSWFAPVSPVLVAFVAWLLLPQQVLGGLRWMITRLRWRRAVGDKQRARQRGRFAEAMALRVAQISDREEWHDERFTELEAEVEMHGRQRRGFLGRPRGETLLRVPSLSAALEKNSDRVVLLEGEPGSGKSVALRHVAQALAEAVKAHPTERGVIPLYLNLKEFKPDSPIDAETIRKFVLKSLRRSNANFVKDFLDKEFDRGMEEGNWLFLFDSYDEIPVILSAVEADEMIEACATALYDFLTGMHPCNGIIATREFRGPKRISWPKFTVMRLTDRQRRDLIDKLGLPREVKLRILGGLEVASPAIRQLAGNPLFLALLCEHQQKNSRFPRNSHVVFEGYIARRFDKDAERLREGFRLGVTTVREVGEQAAYCMAAYPGLGLSPDRAELLTAIEQAGFPVTEETGRALDALQEMRLARRPGNDNGDRLNGEGDSTSDGNDKSFAFAHRRFQEYFATCLVLREPWRADPASLLGDGRWRETAVTLFQAQDQALEPLLSQAAEMLANMTAQLPASGDQQEPGVKRAPFRWPPGSLHLLRLLQDGLPVGDPRRSAEITQAAGALVRAGYDHGARYDQRWAVEVCLIAERETALSVLRQAFGGDSPWLREAAYAQVGLLDEIPDDLRKEIRSVLAGLAAGGRLRQQRLAVDAQIQQLPDPRPERFLKRLFLSAPFVDAALWFVLGLTCTIFMGVQDVIPIAITCLFGHLMFYADRSARQLDSEGKPPPGLRWLYTAAEAVIGVPVSSKMIFLFALVSRSIISFVLIIAVAAEYGPASSTVFAEALVVTLVAFMATYWAPAAIRADWVLNSPSSRDIPSLPFLWLSGKSVKRFRDLASATLAIVAFLGFMIFTGGVPNIPGPNWLYDILIGILVLGLVIFLAAMGRRVVKNFVSSIRDRKLLNTVERNLASTTFAGMLEALSAFRTNQALLIFVQDVKRSRLAADHPAALRALKVFAVRVERSKRLASAVQSLDDPSEAEEATRWSQQSLKVRSGVSQSVIDEISKIIADVEAVDLGLS
jgi:hypothetical protein